MANETSKLDQVILKTKKYITILRARGEVHLTMRIDKVIECLEDILDAAADKYTLTYAMNSQADPHDEDKLPQPVTANAGTTININFLMHPAPATEGYDFLGWSTNEYGSVPEYSVDGQTTITLNSDVTLYPIYGEHIVSNYLVINNTYGSASILVQWYDEDKATWKTSMEVSAGENENFEYHADREYQISFSDGNFQDCVFTGTLGDVTYSNEPCVDGGSGIISAPSGHDWIFVEGVYYLTVSQSSLDNKVRIVNNSSDTVEIYYEEDKSEYGNTFVYGGTSETITIDSQYPYYIRYDNSGSTNSHYFDGTYQGSSFDGSIGYYDGNIQPPEAVGSATEWQFYNNDGGTLTISGSSEPTRVVTYDGENQVGYGENAENPIQYDGGEK